MVWQPVTSRADGIGRILTALAALGALYAFGSAAAMLGGMPADRVWIELWRTAGFLMFAGFFLLLTLRPRASAGIWELTFLHKAIMVIGALTVGAVPEAAQAGPVDAILCVLLAIAYWLTKAWQGWRRLA